MNMNEQLVPVFRRNDVGRYDIDLLPAPGLGLRRDMQASAHCADGLECSLGPLIGGRSPFLARLPQTFHAELRGAAIIRCISGLTSVGTGRALAGTCSCARAPLLR